MRIRNSQKFRKAEKQKEKMGNKRRGRKSELNLKKKSHIATNFSSYLYLSKA